MKSMQYILENIPKAWYLHEYMTLCVCMKWKKMKNGKINCHIWVPFYPEMMVFCVYMKWQKWKSRESIYQFLGPFCPEMRVFCVYMKWKNWKWKIRFTTFGSYFALKWGYFVFVYNGQKWKTINLISSFVRFCPKMTKHTGVIALVLKLAVPRG